MKQSKGSYTISEIERIIFDWPSDVPMSEPLSQKVEQAILRSVPADLYPFVLELITSDGFISKRLALNFLSWLVVNKESWLIDPDKILSLRRVRVGRFCKLIRDAPSEFKGSKSLMIDASDIVRRVYVKSYWHMSKHDFSDAVIFIAQHEKIPMFRVLDALWSVDKLGYDVTSALRSVVDWSRHIGPGTKPVQLELI